MKKSFIFSILVILISANFAQAMTLNESVDFALKNNPSVLASAKKLDASRAKLSQAIGAFYPNVQLSGNYGNSYSQPSTVQITMPTTQGAVTQNYTFGTDAIQTAKGWQASLNQPVFVAALVPGYNIAKKSTDVAAEDLRRISLDTIFNVTKAYYQVLAADRYVALSKESKQMADSHVDQVKTMYSAGVSTQADLLRSEVQATNAQIALTKAYNQAELARAAFNNALGREIVEEVNLTEAGISITIEAIPEYGSLLSVAKDNRPDWKQFLLTKQISEENLKVAQTGLLPTVSLSGQTGNRVTEYPTYGTNVNSWSVAGAASWTLFDGLTTENRIREAAANLDSQKANEKQVWNSIELDVRSAFLSLKTSIDTLGSTKKAVGLSEENQKVATQRYNIGAGTNIDVIDAQVALTQARINHLQAMFDLEVAKAKINNVVGKETI